MGGLIIRGDYMSNNNRSEYEGIDVYVIDPELDALRDYYYNEESSNIEEDVVYNLSEFLSEYEKEKSVNKNLSFIEKFQSEAKNYCYEGKFIFDWFVEKTKDKNVIVDNQIILEFNKGSDSLAEFCKERIRQCEKRFL